MFNYNPNMFHGLENICSPVECLGNTGTVIGLVQSIYGAVDYFTSTKNTDLKAELDLIQAMLTQIEGQISDLFEAVNTMALQTQYAMAQRVISEAVRCYISYDNMTEPESKAYWLREFRKYGGLVRESTNFVMDGMLGNGMIAADILQIIKDQSKVFFLDLFIILYQI